MIETFTALLIAHVLGDYLLQTSRVVRGKRERKPLALLEHGAVLFVASLITLGAFTPAALMLAAAPVAVLTLVHMAIDFGKSLVLKGKRPLTPFLADQALHIATLAVTAWAFPGLWAAGVFGGLGWLPPALALTSGLLVATRAGSFAVGLLMARFPATDLPAGLPEGGRMIGMLERGLIFLLIVVGQPAGIGFLIAAKSVLRFDAAKETSRAGEYVIIGTLASFGWALVAAYSARALAVALGFPAVLP